VRSIITQFDIPSRPIPHTTTTAFAATTRTAVGLVIFHSNLSSLLDASSDLFRLRGKDASLAAVVWLGSSDDRLCGSGGSGKRALLVGLDVLPVRVGVGSATGVVLSGHIAEKRAQDGNGTRDDGGVGLGIDQDTEGGETVGD